MRFRDRFLSPRTARAILSWRILVAVGVGAAMALAGLGIGVAIGVGVGVYAALVLAAVPRAPRRPAIDPFALGEPWRRLVQQSQAAARRLRATIAEHDDGPLRRRLESIAADLERGLDEAWQVAQRGDQIDDAVRRLDPTALRSKLESTRRRAVERPSDDTEAAIRSIESQLSTADRLHRTSEETADRLRRTQTRLDELVARASEVGIGAVDTDGYAREVDDLVVQLEALHAAVDEVGRAAGNAGGGPDGGVGGA